jgi:superfamily II DNA or RNA helicase
VLAYGEFLASKRKYAEPSGFDVPANALRPHLFPFQRDVTAWALRRGRAAIFAGTGMGKTAMQLEWADYVSRTTAQPVLILAPLAVASQTVHEGEKFKIAVNLCREASDVRGGVNITNYERFERFDAEQFAGVVLDESSILKSHDGKTRTALIDAFSRARYRLACTATPAPNDVMELANHAEFLGVSSRNEMLATYFVHDGGETQKWRLKGHAEEPFWEWLASWSVMFRSPADLGYDDADYRLPALQMHQHIIDATEVPEGLLFAVEAQTLIERNRARKSSTADRAARAATIVNAEPDEAWIVWCDLNAEADAVQRMIPGAIQVAGSDSSDVKEQRLSGFSEGRVRVMVSKPSIAGYGMNWQHCARVVFVGLSDSWEAYFQAIRRCWRFGQARAVDCHVVISSAEGAVLANIERKEREASKMLDAMVRQAQIHFIVRQGSRDDFAGSELMRVPAWVA